MLCVAGGKPAVIYVKGFVIGFPNFVTVVESFVEFTAALQNETCFFLEIKRYIFSKQDLITILEDGEAFQ